MSDTYRTPDSPLGRALAQGRLAAAAQRAEREELDRANRAAVDELRATLAALDPPLAVEPGGKRYHLCALDRAARDLPAVMAYPSTAEAVDRLQADRRREAPQIAALIASAPRPAELSPPPRLAPAASRPQPSWVEGPSLAWPAGGAVLLGLAALVACVAAGHPAADVLFSAGAAATVGLLLGCAVDFVWAFLRA